jgi:hypothetical protein
VYSHTIRRSYEQAVSRSDSLFRSSAALSALSRLCLLDSRVDDFYLYAHETISKLNMDVLSNDYESREKKCYRLLVSLAWARPRIWFRNPDYRLLTTAGPLPFKEMLLNIIRSWK